MLQSPAPHEGPAKDADSVVEPGSLSRFRRLAKSLFEVDRDQFQEALAKDETERRAKRGR